MRAYLYKRFQVEFGIYLLMLTRVLEQVVVLELEYSDAYILLIYAIFLHICWMLLL